MMQALFGFLAPVLIYAYIFLLNAGLPGRWVTGYASKPQSEEKLRYRLNGFWVFVVCIATWFGLGYLGWMPWDWLYQVRWNALWGAVIFGLVFSYALVAPAPPVQKSFLNDFFLGRLENPQLWGGRVDAKMWLYLIGAIMLELNLLSYTAYHYQVYGAESSPGIFLALAMFTFFVCDYLTFEEIHLYTYDLFAERVGFKLGWGCIAFYPFFYAIPLWATVHLPNPHMPWPYYLLAGLCFWGGWSLSRGANMQKYHFKRDPAKVFLGIKPQSISDGQRKLLVSGYWGLSRHINYLGEILMGTGIALAVGYPALIWPWLYPMYYVALLFPRQMDDDKRCAAKYGPLWQEYLQKVPYRIIPYIY